MQKWIGAITYSFVFVLAATCQPQTRPPADATVEREQTTSDNGRPELTNSMMEETLLPDPVATPTMPQSVTPTRNPQEKAATAEEEQQLAPSAMPTATLAPPTSTPSPPVPTVTSWEDTGIKAEIYLAAMGGGGETASEACLRKMPARISTPSIVWLDEHEALCVFGLSVETEVAIELLMPDGQLATARYLVQEDVLAQVDVPPSISARAHPIDGYLADGVRGTALVLPLHLSPDTPRGQWAVTIQTEHEEVTASFTIRDEESPQIETRPWATPNLFSYSNCVSYMPQEQVYITGAGLAPNYEYPLALYWESNEYVRAGIVYRLVRTGLVETDANGGLLRALPLRESDFGGRYQAVIVTNRAAESLRYAGPRACFSIPGDATCNNDAEFVADVNIPDYTHYRPGETFTKIWRMRNSGTCTWTNDYHFVHVEGDLMGAPSSVSLPEEVKPGEEVEIAVTFTAPMQADDYVSRWKLEAPNGLEFGDRPYVLITVVN